MTNKYPSPITAGNLEHGDRVIDPEGNPQVIQQVRMIDHERLRITTASGLVRVAHEDEVYYMDE